jgi:hypothetical protein
MADVPCILDGKFFNITSKRDGKIIAKCSSCVNKSISGTSVATSNFVRHLKVTITLQPIHTASSSSLSLYSTIICTNTLTDLSEPSGMACRVKLP